MIQAVLAVVARNPIEVASLLTAWVLLAGIGRLACRWLVRRFWLRWLVWSYLLCGILLSIVLDGKLIAGRSDLDTMMLNPIAFFVLGTASSTLTSLIWPLIWGFLLLWFSGIEGGPMVGRELGVAGIVAALTGYVLAGGVRLAYWLVARR
jgi:hypothetical protein